MTLDAGDQAGGTTRRDALKLSGAAALGGVAAMLANGSLQADAAVLPAAAAHVPTSLRVTLNGVAVSGIKSMGVMSGEYEVSSEIDSTGLWVSVPVGVLSQRVSLTRHFSGDSTFLDLFQAVNPKGGGAGGAGGGNGGASLVVTVRGRRGSSVNTFTMSDCVPVSWTGPVYDAAVMAKGGAADQPTETLSLNFTKIEVK